MDQVGVPPGRSRPHGYETLLRIVVGQQVSTKAAAAIFERVRATIGEDMSPRRTLRLRETSLRKAGLSGRKVEYTRGLARAIVDGTLNLEQMTSMKDEQVIEAITSLKGFGVWSAQMYLMFTLGRMDVWPGGDLGVREGVRLLLNLDERPTEKEMPELGEPFRPYRSAVALLAWHLLHNAPA
ncbi:MAG: DNA-3-methyladenine glycosylase 2 family protein [Myxococcota bacterium]